MTIVRSIAGASFVLSWALLLSARMIGAAIYGAGPGTSYGVGLDHIGMLIPLAAWASLAIGVFLLGPAVLGGNTTDVKSPV